MNFPKWRPPWYAYLNKKLEGSEWIVNTGLIIVIVIALVLLLRGDRLSRTAFFIYLISP